MLGPDIVAQTLSVPAITKGKTKAPWQYHSRGGRHSITPCWGVLLDLMVESSLLRSHVEAGTVVFGLDHPMHDYLLNKEKKLDLVIAKPEKDPLKVKSRKPYTFRDLAVKYEMQLTPSQQAIVDSLPDPIEGPVGAVLLALEAKACMTSFSKSYPRFYDELNSSHRAIHGASNKALAVGLGIINAADTFVSPIINPQFPFTGTAEVSHHHQPMDAQGAIDKVGQLPRRTGDEGEGYDGLGIILLDCPNDGVTPVTLASSPAVPSNYVYGRMVTRVANEYDVRFRNA